MASKAGKVNVKTLLEDVDRYLAFCYQQKKPITKITLTPEQLAAVIKKTGEAKYHGIVLVAQ